MSVIRGSSNPEGLYIYGGVDKWYFHLGIEDKSIPLEDLYDFFEKYITSDFYMVDTQKSSYKGISVWNDWVDDKDGRNFKTHFLYEDWDEPIIMWDVTWNYILNDFKRRLNDE